MLTMQKLLIEMYLIKTNL